MKRIISSVLTILLFFGLETSTAFADFEISSDTTTDGSVRCSITIGGVLDHSLDETTEANSSEDILSVDSNSSAATLDGTTDSSALSNKTAGKQSGVRKVLMDTVDISVRLTCNLLKYIASFL